MASPVRGGYGIESNGSGPGGEEQVRLGFEPAERRWQTDAWLLSPAAAAKRAGA
jgi:hypothetical protein